MNYPNYSTSGYSSPQAAFKALGDALAAVRSSEVRLDDAQTAEAKAKADLQKARNRFNEVRDEVIEICPELLEGYSTGETVGVVDGEVKVVRDR